MYSRFSGERERPIQIPEQYSGWAFSRDRPAKQVPPPLQKQPSPLVGVAKPSPSSHFPIQEEQKEQILDNSPPTEENTDKTTDAFKQEKKPPLPTPLLPLFGNLGHAFPFSHGIGFEELLILGLLILLSRNDCDTETILLVGLLLFCG